jgi:hypothetical protein
MPGYTRRYNIYIEGIDEKLNRFLEAKNVAGRVEHEFTPRRGSDFAGTQNILTGWATLTVETSDPKLCEELENFFRKLENEHEKSQR